MSEDTQQNNNQDSDITLEKLQTDLEQAMNGWKRTAADFENFKKHKEKENRELLEFAKEVTVVKLLPIIDSLEQALRHIPALEDSHRDGNLQGSVEDFAKRYQNWQKGVEGIVMQLDKTLEELGVKKIEAIGKKFDPNFHEAVKEEICEKADGIILDELQSGFILNGKVIRPSQVVISKRK